MSDLSHPRPEITAPWDRKIPEKMLALYLDSVRSFPAWKAMCPHYIHPDVKEVSELGYHSTLLRTEQSEYVFTFSTKTTFIYEIEEEVRTGQLEIRCDNELVLNIGVSCADDADGRPEWVARSVEVFCDGEWVADLLGLAARQQAHERQRLQLETRERQRHAQELTELRQRFGIEDAAPAAGKSKAVSKEPQGRRWLRFWRKSSG
ncbi:MAG TPA: hypothetical protein VJP04_01975 [Terriglobales bacterium]|nr:hypothetical protein [Terriglobales bacterium]